MFKFCDVPENESLSRKADHGRQRANRNGNQDRMPRGHRRPQNDPRAHNQI